MPQILGKSYLSTVFSVLIVLSTVTALIKLPFFKGKIQPFEIFFFFSFLFFLAKIYKYQKRENIKINLIDIAVVFYLLFTTINCLFHLDKITLLETIANYYTICIYFFFSRISFLILISKVRLRKTLNWAIILTGLNCLLGGLFYYIFNIDRFVMIYDNYPYLGDIVRFHGASVSPYIIVSITSIYWLLGTSLNRTRVHILLLLFVIIVSVLTFSKEIIYFCTAAIFVYFFYRVKNKLSFKTKIFTGAMLYIWLFAFFTASTFFVICSQNCETEVFSLGPVFKITDNFRVRPTGYYYLFVSAIEMILQSPIWGVGLGNFENELVTLQNVDIFPKSMWVMEAHDLYWGLIAQLGLPFIVVMVFFLFSLGKTSYDFLSNNSINRKLGYSIIAILIFISFDIMGDVGALHFRHYWIFVGLISGLHLHMKSKTSWPHPLM